VLTGSVTECGDIQLHVSLPAQSVVYTHLNGPALRVRCLRTQGTHGA
jgi:hypothetical protein